jgi:hypothetical protein
VQLPITLWFWLRSNAFTPDVPISMPKYIAVPRNI